MYGLVAYQLSGTIHAGIQYGHAVVDYAQAVKNLPFNEGIYNKWATKDKTFIILNGGTTNNNPERLGSLNQHLALLKENLIHCQDFYEPDLGDQLTAVVFLIDERVFDKITYPDFKPERLPFSFEETSLKQISNLEAENNKNYQIWAQGIGGAKNVFLREFLKPFRLA